MTSWRDSCDSEIRSRVWVLISGELCYEIKKSVIAMCFAVIASHHKSKRRRPDNLDIMEDGHAVRMVNNYESENNIQGWAPERMAACSDLHSLIYWTLFSSEWSYRPNHNTVAITVAPFIGDIVEVSIHDLVDHIGAKVDPREGKRMRSWFPLVLHAKAVRGKNPQGDDRFSGVQTIKGLINSLPIHEMAGRSEIPAISRNAAIFARKYSSQKPCNVEASLVITKQPFEALKEFGKCQMGLG